MEFSSISGMKKPQRNTARTLIPDIKNVLFFWIAITGVTYLTPASLHK